MTFLEALCLRKGPVNQLMNKFVPLNDDFCITYTSDTGGYPSLIWCSLLAFFYIRTGAEIDLLHNSVHSLQYFHSFLPVLKLEHF